MEQGITWIWSALSSASPIAAAICFLAMLKAWRDLADERQERKASQQETKELLERTLKALGDTQTAVNSSTSVAESTRNAIYLLRDTLAGFGRGGHQGGG